MVQEALQQAQGVTGSVGNQMETGMSPGIPELQPLRATQGSTGGVPEMFNPDQETDSNGTQGLDSKFSNQIERMVADAPGNANVFSGRRDTGRQKELWQEALQKYGSEQEARRWVAPPTGTRMSDGTIAQGSRHESGIAADLKYENDSVKQWFHDNAHRYGLHFPLDNEDWHIEPIGSR